jgi:hypothetical protein
MQLLLQLQCGLKFLLSMVWVKLWGPASAVVSLGMLPVLSLVQGFFVEQPLQ